jgi:hypothetical protein
MSRPPHRRWAAWLGVPFLVVALGGCGSSSSGNGVASKTPAQILDAAVAAARSAATVHVSGSMSDEGKPVSLDLELEAGKGGKGTIALEGLSVKLVQINGAVYLNGSEAFYRHVAGATAGQLLRGKWLKAPASDVNFASLASLTDLDKLISSTLAAHGALVGAGTSTLDGHKVVGVTDRTRGGSLYVATTGAAYPLEIAKSGSSGGRITFDRWNQPVTLEAPVGALNINQLKSGR